MKRTRTLSTIFVLALMLVLVAGLSARLPQGAAHAQDPDRDAAPQQAATPQAPLGTAFTYQGRLTDSDGPITDICNFTFDLYDTPSDGTPLYTDSHLGVSVSEGYFTVELDFGATAFAGEARYLGISVNCGAGATVLSPRQPLTPAPYSLYSQHTPWSGITGMPAGFADNVDDDTTYSPGFGLDLLGTSFHVVTSTIQQRVGATCGVGSAIRVINPDGTVVCESDDDTTYGPGFGLDLLGTSFYVVTSTIQQRVAATCGVGSAIRVINADGSVVCETDDDSTSFWSLTGNAGTSPGVNFLGTTDAASLVLAVSGTTALRLEPNAASPNLIGGHSSNNVAPGVVGATIAGGGQSGGPNQVGADLGTIGGGSDNDIGANSDHATLGGGEHNTILGNSDHATLGGGYYNAIGMGSRRSTIGGGENNVIQMYNEQATIAGGYDNLIEEQTSWGTVGGGQHNTVSFGSFGATIGGGEYNRIQDVSGDATIGGGNGNDIRDGSENTTIGGGQFNHIGRNSGNATIGGGEINDIGDDSDWATIPGGRYNEANGPYAFAAGRRAHANQQGAFVWADSNDFDFPSVVADSFNVRATGGVTLVTGIDGSGVPNAGAVLPSGSGSWSMLSDRALKENLAAVDAQELLARLAQVPMSTWNYKAQDASIRHIGPMAQDFYAAFGLGESQRRISTVDADGVALAAIQGLYAQNQQLAAENAAQQAQIENLEARLAALERGGVSPPSASALPTWLLLGGLVLAGGVVLQRRGAGGER